MNYYQAKFNSTADEKHVYVDPLFGKVGNTSAQIIKSIPQTIIRRGLHHMMSSMFSALTKAGYGDGGEGSRVVPIILTNLPGLKLPQDADNTVNRQGVPIY